MEYVVKKQMEPDIRKTKSDFRNIHYLFIKVVQKTNSASKTENLDEAVMKCMYRYTGAV
jgi:hypothetical protein